MARVRPPENHLPIQEDKFSDVIPSPDFPCVKEADKPGLSGKPLNAKIGQILWPIRAILSMLLFFVCLKITDQSREMNFRM